MEELRRAHLLFFTTEDKAFDGLGILRNEKRYDANFNHTFDARIRLNAVTGHYELMFITTKPLETKEKQILVKHSACITACFNLHTAISMLFKSMYN